MKKILSFPPVSFGVKAAELYLEIGAPRAAAALSYFLILTLFPLLVCVNYFIGLFHLDLENLLLSLDQFLPDEVLLVMRDYLGYVASPGRCCWPAWSPSSSLPRRGCAPCWPPWTACTG